MFHMWQRHYSTEIWEAFEWIALEQSILYSVVMLLSKVSKAFSDDNRLKILKYLCDGERNVTQVAEKLNVEENLASHHLRVLATLGFLKNDKKGREVFYRINDVKFISLIKDLKRSKVFREIILRALDE